MTRWAVLTGEYPPQPGGVADYTRLVAGGLAAAGDAVTVFAPPAPGPDPADAGVAVVRLPDRFGLRGLVALDRSLLRLRPDRVLIQYVPQAYGWKGMNVPFAAWVALRAARGRPVWVMFHEVMSGTDPCRRVRNAVLRGVTRQTARLLARAAARLFVSTPAWGAVLRRIARPARPAEWLPIPSGVPSTADPDAVSAVRSRFGPAGIIVGHFGTFGGMNVALLGPALAGVLRGSANRVGLLVGQGGAAYRNRLAADHPDLATRLAATGEIPASDAAAHLAACDLLIQPYPDGATTRRTSLMAGLALGVPVVTNLGFLSEPVWAVEAAGVALAPSPAPADLGAAAEVVLALSPRDRAGRGAAAAAWYRSRFALEHTVARLRNPAPVGGRS